MDAGEKEAFDTHLADGQTIQEEIDRLESAQAMAAKAAPVATEKTASAASASRTTPTQVHVKQLPKGTGFARYALAVAAGRGSYSDTLRYAERWRGSTPEVIDLIERAAAGTSTDGTFAGPLVYASNLVSEFIELLRPMTVIGKLEGIRNVPFNVRIPRQTAGATVGWVAEGGVKNVVEEDFDTVTLTYHKMAAIIVLTEELVRFSQPNAEEIARRDLTEQIARFMDQQFLRLTVAAVANTNPASITNGVTPVAATGDDADALEADLFNALAPFDNTNVGDGRLYIVMQPKLARSIALLRPDVGNGRLYPELTQSGGSLLGYPVITSNSVDNGFIVLVKADEILLADDGNVTLDASREATLDMNNGSSPAYSLWQKNAVAIRAERFITWTKRRATGAVSLISGAYYGPATVADS